MPYFWRRKKSITGKRMPVPEDAEYLILGLLAAGWTECKVQTKARTFRRGPYAGLLAFVDDKGNLTFGATFTQSSSCSSPVRLKYMRLGKEKASNDQKANGEGTPVVEEEPPVL